MSFCRYLPILVVLAAATGCGEATPRSAMVEDAAVRAKPTAPAAPTPDDVAAAQQRAEVEHKPLLLFFTAEWCSFCRQMEDEAFRRPEFRTAAQRYVVVRVEAARHPELCAKYRVTAYPTLILAAPDGTALDRLVGLSDAASVATKMNAALATFLALRPAETTIAR